MTLRRDSRLKVACCSCGILACFGIRMPSVGSSGAWCVHAGLCRRHLSTGSHDSALGSPGVGSPELGECHFDAGAAAVAMFSIITYPKSAGSSAPSSTCIYSLSVMTSQYHPADIEEVHALCGHCAVLLLRRAVAVGGLHLRRRGETHALFLATFTLVKQCCLATWHTVARLRHAIRSAVQVTRCAAARIQAPSCHCSCSVLSYYVSHRNMRASRSGCV